MDMTKIWTFLVTNNEVTLSLIAIIISLISLRYIKKSSQFPSNIQTYLHIEESRYVGGIVPVTEIQNIHNKFKFYIDNVHKDLFPNFLVLTIENVGNIPCLCHYAKVYMSINTDGILKKLLIPNQNKKFKIRINKLLKPGKRETITIAQVDSFPFVSFKILVNCKKLNKKFGIPRYNRIKHIVDNRLVFKVIEEKIYYLIPGITPVCQNNKQMSIFPGGQYFGSKQTG